VSGGSNEATNGANKRETNMNTETILVCGNQVQLDESGVGHCWVDVSADDIPPGIRAEIECEILDGDREECDDFVASNGRHYRW
jgi:hypothetical protein